MFTSPGPPIAGVRRGARSGRCSGGNLAQEEAEAAHGPGDGVPGEIAGVRAGCVRERARTEEGGS